MEDDRDIAALFRHVLDVAGHQTEIVLDGREAMKGSMRKLLDNPERELGRLKINLGVLLCDLAYENTLQIMKDIELARKKLFDGLYTNPSIFDQDRLR